jgi:hypothetical protein
MNRTDFPDMDLLADIYVSADLKTSGIEDIEETNSIKEISVSDSFKKKIQRIIFYERSLAYLKRIAIYFLVVFTGVGTLILINEDIRAATIRFFKETFDTHKIFFDGDEMSNIDYKNLLYVPTWIPEGYELNYSMVDAKLGISNNYINKTTHKELFYSCDLIINASVGLNTEGTVARNVVIGGKNVEYNESVKEGFNSSIIWTDQEGRVVYIAADEDFDTLKNIYESLELDNTLIKKADDLYLNKQYTFDSKEFFYDENRVRYIYTDENSRDVLYIEKNLTN